jgi:hypothetical protein
MCLLHNSNKLKICFALIFRQVKNMGHPSLPPAVIEMQTLNKFSLKQNSMWNILAKNFMESPPRFLSKIIKTRFVEPNVIK